MHDDFRIQCCLFGNQLNTDSKKLSSVCRNSTACTSFPCLGAFETPSLGNWQQPQQPHLGPTLTYSWRTQGSLSVLSFTLLKVALPNRSMIKTNSFVCFKVSSQPERLVKKRT